MIQKKSTGSDVSDEQLRVLAEYLIQQQTTMTLATAAGDVAWAAPVYYVFYKSSFYFFSESTSRHIQESMKSGQASAAIYAFASTWKEIRGIQMAGCIRQIPTGLEAIRVLRAYLTRFPFTKEFFDTGVPLTLEAFAKRFKVRLYKFEPDLIYYLDNQIRFGFRQQITI